MGADGSWHVWSVAADGGDLQQLTAETGDQTVPRWSGDGQWVYYSWDDGSGRNIWRVHAVSRHRERVTRGGSGWAAIEAGDGTGIYYPDTIADSALMFQPFDGGPARQVLPCVLGGAAVALGPLGIYYLPCSVTAPYPNLGSRPDGDPPVPVSPSWARLGRPVRSQFQKNLSGRLWYHVRTPHAGARPRGGP